MSERNGYTKTQQRILEMLSDGMPHTYLELFSCLPDPEGAMMDYGAGRATLAVKISDIRKHLRPKGQDIICEFNDRRRMYRHVRLLNVSE